MSVSSDGDSRALKVRKLLPDGHAQLQLDIGQRSDESDDSDDELFPEIDMEALRQRGKGNYTCPKSYQCKKGGVDKEGNLVVFDRNSSFAYVVTADPSEHKHLLRRRLASLSLAPDAEPRSLPSLANRAAQAALQQTSQTMAV